MRHHRSLPEVTRGMVMALPERPSFIMPEPNPSSSHCSAATCSPSPLLSTMANHFPVAWLWAWHSHSGKPHLTPWHEDRISIRLFPSVSCKGSYYCPASPSLCPAESFWNHSLFMQTGSLCFNQIYLSFPNTPCIFKLDFANVISIPKMPFSLLHFTHCWK